MCRGREGKIDRGPRQVDKPRLEGREGTREMAKGHEKTESEEPALGGGGGGNRDENARNEGRIKQEGGLGQGQESCKEI